MKDLKIKTARVRLKRECEKNGWTFHSTKTIKEKVKFGKNSAYILDGDGEVIKEGTLFFVLYFMGLIASDEKLQTMADFAKEKHKEYKRIKNAKRKRS